MHAPRLTLFHDYKYFVGYLLIGIAFIVFNATAKDLIDESPSENTFMID